MDRRTFLVLAAAAVVTAGCTSNDAEPRPPSGEPIPPDDPDSALRRRVAESEAALLAAHRSALAADPSLASTLEPIIAQHEDHLARVAGDGTPPAAARPSRSPEASPPGASSTADRVLAELSAAEFEARDQRIAACDAAVDPALARELCLIGASEAQHAAFLNRSRREVRP